MKRSDCRIGKLRTALLPIIERNGWDLTIPLLKGSMTHMIEETAETKPLINKAMRAIRKSRGIKNVKPKNTKTVLEKTGYYTWSVESGFNRNSPHFNMVTMEEIKDYLELWKLFSGIAKRDRVGLSIGTLSPFAISINHTNYSGRLLVDELSVYDCLRTMSGRTHTYTGNLKSEKTARRKQRTFQEIGGNCGANKVGPVTPSECYLYVKSLAQKNRHKKDFLVIFAMSGEKWGDYKEVFRRLKSEFLNLRVIATAVKKSYLGFDVKLVGFTPKEREILALRRKWEMLNIKGDRS